MVETDLLRSWFCREVLPLEAALMRYIRRQWNSPDEVTDIRQEVYASVLVGASRELPAQAGAYVFAVARNLMINRARRARIVSFEQIADFDRVDIGADLLTPERHLNGREALRRVQAGLDQLPPRCRDVVRLRKIEGLSIREVAERLGVGTDAVEQQTTLGMRALTDFMLGGSGRIQRAQRKAKKRGSRA